MSVIRCSFKLAIIIGLACSGMARAQEGADSLDSLLQDLALPAETAPATDAVPAEVVAPDAMPAEPVEAAIVEETVAVPQEPEAVVEPIAEPVVESAPVAEPMELAPVEVPAEAVEAAPVVEPVVEAPAAEVMEEVVAEIPEAVVAEPVAAEPAMDAPVAEVVEPTPVEVMEEAPVAEAIAVEEVLSEPVAEVVAPAVSMDDLLAPAAETAPAPEAVVEEAPAVDPMAGLFEPEPVPVVEAEIPVEAAAEAAVDAEAVPVEAAPEVGAEGGVEALPEGVDPAAFALQEEIRRQARETEGRKALETGLASLQAGRLDEAIVKLQEAQAKIPARAATAGLVDQARSQLGVAYLRKSQLALDNDDLKTARQSLNLARPFVAPGTTDDLDRKLTRMEERAAIQAAKPVPVKARPEVVEREKTIKELLGEGRQYLELGDYNAAEALFEKVLLRDEYNIDAMRFLRKLDEQRYKARTKEREATEADMMQRVRDTWNPPVRDDIKLPQAVQNRGAVETKTSAQKLQEKMESIIIPSIEFRQANITDVVNFLVEASISGDKIDGTGVNIILNLNMPGAPDVGAPAPAPDAAAGGDFGGGFGGGFGDDLGAAPAAPAGASSNIPTITLNLRRISLLDAIKYITEVARLKFRLEENAVMITPEGVVSGRVITRLYPVQPSIIDVVVDREEAPERTGEFVEMGSTRSNIKKSDVREFFEKAGVPFPQGTSITYNPTISQLIVANTPENLEVFERILSRLNVIPNQVEIEARFVEISQDDLEELGFQWILTDNWEIAQKDGGGGLGGQESIIANADANGFTKGLRFFNQVQSSGAIEPFSALAGSTGQTPLGGILSFASVLTNPEVKVVIQALSQHGGTDLLSAPRVTTRSGVNAQIQVVKEIIYPTEFEVSAPTIVSSPGSDGGGATVTPPTVTPGSFETRETGVILNVTPTVGPDGYTIDLTMVPEVAELVDWIQYGSSSSAGGTTYTFNLPQPVFASRNVTTSIVIWDGQTVVMGGLIREDLVKVKDKVPLLGDIPLLGRLFRSEGQYSQKKNLLIFVTARLVDPSGKPIHRSEAVGAADAQATPEVAAPKP